MDEPALLSKRELAFLRELGARHVDYLLVGLSAAALQGAPVVTQDVDLWFRNLNDPALAEALRAVGGVYIPPTDPLPPMFAGAGLGLFDIVLRMDGLGTFEEEQRCSIILSVGNCDVPVLRLDRIIASKRAAGRHKDRLVLDVLEDALRTIECEDI